MIRKNCCSAYLYSERFIGYEVIQCRRHDTAKYIEKDYGAECASGVLSLRAAGGL